MRLYPLAIRALLPVWRRRGGVTGYVGLAGAVERRTATALPAFTLVLALTLAAFGGMVNGAIVGGQIAYSWQATGADAVIDTNSAAYDVTPTVEKSINAIPGVRHSTAVWTTTWQLPLGRQLTVAAVDPAGYAEVTAATPFPRTPVSAFGPADSTRPVTAATVVPVLASPAAAAALGPGIVQLTSIEPMGPIRIRVAGIVAGTPAQPDDGMFVLMPLRTLPGVLGQPAPNLALITGAHIDRSRLARLVGEALPAVLAAFAAAFGCALALPALVSPALDLSVFTGPGAPVTYRPDLAALGVPCLVILALTGVALVAETSRSRRHGVTGLLRVQ